MQKSLALMVVIAMCSVVAYAADDHPKVETFAGFTYMRANSATNVPAFNTKGGGGQLAVNFSKSVGFVMDLGAVHNGNIGDQHLDNTFTNFLFGPRVNLRHSRVIPYFNVLFGGMHASTSVAFQAVPIPTNPIYLPGAPTVPPNSPVTGRLVASQTAFAMATGGGLDIKINKHVSFRPIGLDWMLTRLQNIRDLNDRNQHHIRYTTGFNVMFGAQ
jgi:opacity protein-like surface antigen